MKGLILSGGAGTRLRPITHSSAKQLVPIANKPILFYGIEAMAEAGIHEVGIVVGETGAEIREAVGTGESWGIAVTYIEQDAPLGLAHAVCIARSFLGDDDFVMYLGDNLLRQGVKEFVKGFEADRTAAGAGATGLAGGPGLTGPGAKIAPAAAQILLARVPNPQSFGVAELGSAGEVVRLVEKPEHPPSDLALVGVYLFDPTIHEAVRAISPSPRGELEITDAIQWLIDNGYRVRQEVLEGYWKDTGSLEALLEGNRLVLEAIESRLDGTVDEHSRIEGRVVIEPGATITRSTVRGPAIIGHDSLVVDSFIGPFTAVAHKCEIVATDLEHSVVWSNSSIRNGGRIVDSLIGKQVEVSRSTGRPMATRLMVGDHSRIELA